MAAAKEGKRHARWRASPSCFQPGSDANAALAQPGADRNKLQNQIDVLTHTMALANATPAATVRANLFKLVLDTVWWRRVIYFVSLFLVMFAALFPLLAIVVLRPLRA